MDSRVADLLDRATRDCFGNASSIHRAGQNARQMLEQSRRSIASALGAQAHEVVFTGGGTEANNLAIRGILSAGMHAITSMIEHPSVTEPFRQLQAEGVEVTYLPVNSGGVVDVGAVADAIKPNTALVSIMMANNETGVIQPVGEIAAVLRARRAAGHTILLHSDGVQALGKVPVNLPRLGVDLFSASGHKIYAPKGIGLLYVRRGVKLKSLHLGGRHERGIRAGTENVPAAVALDSALSLCLPDEQTRLTSLRDEFESRMVSEGLGVRVNAASAQRLGNTSNLYFPGMSGEALLIALDMQGMCVSTGSACSSGSIEASPVLLAMGLTPKEARSCIRFSFGRGNTRADIAELVSAVCLYARKMRGKQLV